jgi:hypothetical protein
MTADRAKPRHTAELICAAAFVVSACITQVPIGEGVEGGASGGFAGTATSGSGGAAAARPTCGAEAARGGYLKSGTVWDGTAGNPYGYPPDHRPLQDCAGFGFHDTCDFWELCDVRCTTSGECPMLESSRGPECRSLRDSPPQCVQPCGDGSPCPGGMECVNHVYGFGQICMWKKIYG